MKAIFAAAALLTAGAAIAQDTPAQPVAPSNSAPERDARGIPVGSEPASAPPGTNAPVPAEQPAAFGASPTTPDPPHRPRTRTFTDTSPQTSERGRR